LPEKIVESDVRRVADADLVAALCTARIVVSNDSAAMHLSALLGCRTLVIARTANVAEWIPPATKFIASTDMPRGYRPHPRYNSDDILNAWPNPEEVVRAVSEFVV